MILSRLWRYINYLLTSFLPLKYMRNVNEYRRKFTESRLKKRIVRNKTNYAQRAKLWVRRPVTRKIMLAHNRIIHGFCNITIIISIQLHRASCPMAFIKSTPRLGLCSSSLTVNYINHLSTLSQFRISLPPPKRTDSTRRLSICLSICWQDISKVVDEFW